MRLAVLGSPIAHSVSPALHAAAYRELGLDWSYGRAEVTAATLPAYLAELDGQWRGLSLTMPLKRVVVPLVAAHDPLVDRLGLANTVLLGAEPRLANTDVGGIEAVLAPWRGARSAVVLGAGATAASALEALARLGVRDRAVAARSPERAAQELAGLADRFVPFAEAALDTASIVVSTLPGGVVAPVTVPVAVAGAPLLDVAYAPWPSPLGAAWDAAGGALLHGLEMLIEQALLQVRLFVAGDEALPLPAEDRVRAAMRAAVGR